MLTKPALALVLSLAPTLALAQQPVCQDVAAVLAVSDWKSLATSSFKTFNQSTRKAPARALLKRFGSCEVSISAAKGALTASIWYECKVPSSMKAHKSAEAAIAAYDKQFAGCFSGWKRTVSDPGPGITFLEWERGADKFQVMIEADGGIDAEVETVSFQRPGG